MAVRFRGGEGGGGAVAPHQQPANLNRESPIQLSCPLLVFFGFGAFSEPCLAYDGATAKVRIAGATYAAFLTNSRR